MNAAKVTGEVRWGILGAAHIAGKQFLPAYAKREAAGQSLSRVVTTGGLRPSPTCMA